MCSGHQVGGRGSCSYWHKAIMLNIELGIGALLVIDAIARYRRS
ncbi:hypothetical protein [Budvicia aquatica]|nr:hypothetical protein [Budvicia aquatica]